MLDGRDADIALAEYGATLGFNDVLSYSLDDRLAFEVDALYLITGVLWCRIESHGEAQACVQSFSTKRETTFQCFLF